jgi:hypothetical protein
VSRFQLRIAQREDSGRLGPDEFGFGHLDPRRPKHPNDLIQISCFLEFFAETWACFDLRGESSDLLLAHMSTSLRPAFDRVSAGAAGNNPLR